MKDIHKKKQNKIIELPDAGKCKIGIVVSEWNGDITTSLLKACQDTLKKNAIQKENIFTVYVPGSFELPTGARIIDDQHNCDAVICLGCIIKGETRHDEYISNAVATGLVQLGVLRTKPFIFGVLTPNTLEQARERAGGKVGNKGEEAAIAALKMLRMKASLHSNKKSIGF